MNEDIRKTPRLVSVVIPCYKSQDYLENTVEGIRQMFQAHPELSCQLILINDGSGDNTFAVIRNLCNQYPWITGIDLERNYGQGLAKMAGIPYIQGNYAVFMDDDGQHTPEAIPLLIHKIDEDYDLVYAQFRHRKEPLWRQAASKGHDWMLSIFTGKPGGLTITSFFALSSRAINHLKAQDCYAGSVGLTLFPVTKKVAGVPIDHQSRTEGSSHYTLHKLFLEWSRMVNGSKQKIPKNTCHIRTVLNNPERK